MILTSDEAYQALDYNSADELPLKVTSIILPAVDDYLKNATGKDWGALTATYTVIDPLAKQVAAVLLVRWLNNPDMVGQVIDAPVLALIAQLEAKYLVEVQANG
jgi:hypothetical protein